MISETISTHFSARLARQVSACSAFALVLTAQPVLAQEESSTPPVTEPREDTDTLTAGSVAIPAPPAGVLPEVETIISDEEFDSEIPELNIDDPELVNELESIEEFERRFASEQADANPNEGAVAPLLLPELADGDAVEEIGDAPIRDAELAQPLPPLESFEVEEVQFAEQATEDAVTVVNYDTKVNGLDTADDQTEVNLASAFSALSALNEADGEAANVAMLAARLTEDSALLQRILRAEGWYDATVATRIERPDDADGQPLTAVLDVAAGERYTFAEIVIEAEPTVPEDLIEKNFAIKVNEPVVAERVQAAEAQIAVALPEEGYPFAQVGQRDILLDQETSDGVYTLPVDIGPRSRFGGFETTGDLAFDADHVALLARFEKGEIYDSRLIDDLRQALVATNLFDTVTVKPVQTGEPAGDGTEFVTVAVEQNAGPPRSLSASAGFGTGEGITLSGDWTHRNLFPPEGAVIGNVLIGTQQQGVGGTFRRANAGRRDRTFEAGVNLLRVNYDAFEAFTGRINALVSYVSTPIWQKRITYAYGAEVLATVEDDFDFDLNDRIDRTFFIGALTGQIGLDTSDNLLNPTEGFRITALVQPEGSLQGEFDPYVRTIIDASTYFAATDSIVLAGRARVGTIQGVSREDIAPSRRLYAGGGGSIRGFGFQDVGPTVSELNPDFDPDDPDETASEFTVSPIGGRSVIEAAAEVRYRFGDYGVVAFVDAGQVYESSSPQFSDIRYGVGIGGRFYTNFGPFRLDVATPIGRRDGEALINVYVSIGQAF